MTAPALWLVGHPGLIHVGAHLAAAARAAGLTLEFADAGQASAGAAWARHWAWRMQGHRPPRLGAFSHQLVAQCRRAPPRWLLATGQAPLDRDALEALGRLGIQRLNYLTDDPWNPAHRARWFLDALPGYDQIFSPRHAGLDELRRLGCRQVTHLPFAYNPDVHYPEPPGTAEARARFACDVVFIGGADQDRLPWIRALLRAGVAVHLYGGYWDRDRATAPAARGHADPAAVRRAVGGAKVALGLVRRANRDGHAMRTFELPAMGACLLMEDTADHRALFGEDGAAVRYARTPEEAVGVLRRLLEDEPERQRLSAAAHRLITQGRHTYRDRLATMLGLA